MHGTGTCAGVTRKGDFFFFSSRRRHTRFDCDWSSDVCSSDLCRRTVQWGPRVRRVREGKRGRQEQLPAANRGSLRSEERRVGKSVDLGGRRSIKKKKEILDGTLDRGEMEHMGRRRRVRSRLSA